MMDHFGQDNDHSNRTELESKMAYGEGEAATIGNICSRDTTVVPPDVGVEQATQIIRDHHVGDVVAAPDESGHESPAGILTDRELVVELMAKRVATGST